MSMASLDQPKVSLLIEGFSIIGETWTPIHSNQLKISLSFYTQVDLTPLKLCNILEHLDLSLGNKLREIDLSPLSYCPQLKSIILRENRLSKINVSPLRYCKNLEKLNLNNNLITEIDLSILKCLPSFKQLDLSNNKISNLDLSVLNQNESIETLLLKDNYLTNLNVTPMTKCPNLTHFEIDDDVNLYTKENITWKLPHGLMKYKDKIKLYKKNTSSCLL
jgi:Leucine-rich repeat (LRR) protein